MDKRAKSKTRKDSDKPKQGKKKKSVGPTCSAFLSQLTRKLMLKKKQEEASNNIVQSLVNSLTDALPIEHTVKTPEKKESPAKLEPLQTSPLKPNDVEPDKISYRRQSSVNSPLKIKDTHTQHNKQKVPEMPITRSEELQNFGKKITKDKSVVTTDSDVAGEITKHVATLRKISLIAEEFNKKTAKNLKEIVDSVQQDLIKKLEEVRAEQVLNAPEKTITMKQ